MGTLFFRGGLVRKVVTGYSGDTFPNFTPNPIFAGAYERGEVEVEHWSFLTFSQRLEAAARGLPAVVTRSLAGSSMAGNEGFSEVDSPYGKLGLLAPLTPDVALLHAPVADTEGNVALHPPLLEGVWGALAARRGAIVTVERVVDDLRAWSHLVRIPAHRVLAVCEAPLGAHPGGLFTGDLPVDGYGEDYDFWVDVRTASRSDAFDEWIREWVLDVKTQDDWLERLGPERIAALHDKAAPDSWKADEQRFPPDTHSPPNRWELAAVWGARHLRERVLALDADAVLAGAGVANLSAWLGVAQARAEGSAVQLTAEIGLWGYEPTPADPFVLNHRNFPRSSMLARRRHGARRARRWSRHDDGRVSRRCADRPSRQHQLDAGARRPVPCRIRWWQRRCQRRGRNGRRRHTHAGAHAVRVWLRHVAGPHGASGRHRSRRAGEAGGARRDGRRARAHGRARRQSVAR